MRPAEKSKKSVPEPPKPNLLVNDGNFLERFKQMQQGASNKTSTSSTGKKKWTMSYYNVYMLKFLTNKFLL